MNTKRKGRRYEWKTRDILKKAGYFVIRSASSAGPFDIVALAPPHQVRLIQVKCNKGLSEAEEETLQEFKHTFPIFSVEVWLWKDRMKEPIIRRF